MVLVHKSYLDYGFIQEILVGDDESNIERGLQAVWLSRNFTSLCFSTLLCKIGDRNSQGCYKN